ncbi:MAG TPA: ATP-binding protein [Candidatus Obscuribacterales bacterium]
MLIGIALFVQRRNPILQRACAAIAGVFAALTLLQDVGGVSLGVDQFLVKDWLVATGASHPGRMGPNTCILFILLSVAILLLNGTRKTVIAQILGALVVWLSVLSVAGYCYGFPALYKILDFSELAFISGVLFIVAGVSLFLARPEIYPAALLLSNDIAGRVTSPIVLAAIIFPFQGMITGFQRRLSVDTLFFVIATTVVFPLIAFVSGYWLRRQHREIEAARDQALAALQVSRRFLSTVSHEVRTPMAGIIGLTELLTLEDLGAENNATVQTIFQSSKRLLQILNDLLDAARMEAGKLSLEHTPFAIRPVLGDIRQLILPEAQKKHLDVIGSCDTNIPELLCGDELRLRQILLNLAFNAVKFTDCGEVNVSATLKERVAEKTVIRFTVTDTGIGIKPEEQQRLFEPFAQAQDSTTRVYGGTGLGLSISKSLVEMMGGVVGVTSEPGKGSTFWFEIPFSHGQSTK